MIAMPTAIGGSGKANRVGIQTHVPSGSTRNGRDEAKCDRGRDEPQRREKPLVLLSLDPCRTAEAGEETEHADDERSEQQRRRTAPGSSTIPATPGRSRSGWRSSRWFRPASRSSNKGPTACRNTTAATSARATRVRRPLPPTGSPPVGKTAASRTTPAIPPTAATVWIHITSGSHTACPLVTAHATTSSRPMKLNMAAISSRSQPIGWRGRRTTRSEPTIP